MPVLQPGIYRSQNDPDFVYEVTPDGGALAYPTRAGIAGEPFFGGNVQPFPSSVNFSDFVSQYRPVATSYTGKSKTAAEAAQEFRERTGRSPYENPAETTPNFAKITQENVRDVLKSGFDETRRILADGGVLKQRGVSRNVGDLIPGGGGLRYEAEDIANLADGGEPLAPAATAAPTITATDALKAIGLPNIPSEEYLANEAIRRITERPETAIETRLSEAEKAAVKTQAEIDKRKILETAATKGVIFSPAFTDKPVSAIEASLVAKLAGIEDKRALEVIKAARQEAKELTTESRQRAQDFINLLDKQGLTIDPFTGAVVPSLAGERLDITEAQLDQGERRLALQYEQLQSTNDYRIQQLELAAERVRNASERAVLTNELNFYKLLQMTTASPGQIVNVTTGLPVKLNNEQAIKIADYQNILSATDRVKSLLEKVSSTGAINGWVYKNGIYMPVVQRELRPQELELMQEMYRISNQYVYLVSGKQINEQEYVRLSKTVPDIRATKETNEVVINNFRQYLQGGYDNYLRINGWKINQGAPSMQSTGVAQNNPLGL